MMPSSRWFNLGAAITDIYVDEDQGHVSIIDRARRYTTLKLQGMKILQSVSIYKPAEHPFDYYQRSVRILDLKRLFFWPYGSIYGYIISTDPVISFEYRYTHHHATVTKVGRAHRNPWVVSGDESGHAYIINLEHGGVERRLPPLADAISACVFSTDDMQVSIAGFDNHIATYDYWTMEQTSKVFVGSVVEAMNYINEHIILAILRDGRIAKIDTQKGKIIQEKKLSSGLWPTVMHLSPSKKFVYLGTRQSMLKVIHITSLEQMFALDCNVGGITSIAQSLHFLFVGFSSGEVVAMNYREFEKEFSEAVALERLDDANVYFENNAFLMTHESTWEIYEQWMKQKKSISVLLSEGEIEEAKKMAEPFMFHPKCRLEMEELEGSQGELAAMLRFIKSRDFARAYGVVEKNPSLKESEHYRKLEQLWRELFAKASRLLGRDPVLNKEPVKKLLHPFSEVPQKKAEILSMLKNVGVFRRAEAHIKEKNFKGYYVLVGQYSFLKETPLYEKMEWLQEELKQKLHNALDSEDFAQSIHIAETLEQFQPSQSYALTKINYIKKLMWLDRMLDSGRLGEACSVVSEIGAWNTQHKQIIRYVKAKESFINKARKNIEFNRNKEVYLQAHQLGGSKEAEDIISVIMRYMYENQLHYHLNPERRFKVDWEATLRHYICYFGISKHLDSALQKAGIPIPKRPHEEKCDQERIFVQSIIHYKTNS